MSLEQLQLLLLMQRQPKQEGYNSKGQQPTNGSQQQQEGVMLLPETVDKNRCACHGSALTEHASMQH